MSNAFVHPAFEEVLPSCTQGLEELDPDEGPGDRYADLPTCIAGASRARPWGPRYAFRRARSEYSRGSRGMPLGNRKQPSAPRSMNGQRAWAEWSCS